MLYSSDKNCNGVTFGTRMLLELPKIYSEQSGTKKRMRRRRKRTLGVYLFKAMKLSKKKEKKTEKKIKEKSVLCVFWLLLNVPWFSGQIYFFSISPPFVHSLTNSLFLLMGLVMCSCVFCLPSPVSCCRPIVCVRELH